MTIHAQRKDDDATGLGITRGAVRRRSGRGKKSVHAPAIQCNCGDHVFRSISKGFVVLVSPEDGEHLEYSWHARVRPGDGYITIQRSTTRGKRILSREILGPADGMEVDHKNRNTLDNRRQNLRECTKSQNCANRATGRLRVLPKGVTFSDGRFVARIRAKGKAIHIGRFRTADEAGAAYAAAAQRLHGDFARAD